MMLSMMSDAPTANITASSGGTVNAGTASVAFAPNSFQTSSGAAYTGTVKVAARFLDPSKSSFYNFFPGDMQAERTDASITSLVSCGVLRVELKGSSGETLKLDPSKPAILTCPKPNDPKAPTSLQLWSFDETIGMWKEEGVASLQGNNYVGTVTHFTDYNFDYCGVENGTLQFRIVCSGTPISGVICRVLDREVVTGVDGMINIRRVAADGRPVTIDVRSADNGGTYFLNTPVPVNMVPSQLNDMKDISLDSPCPASLTGTLTDCGDSKIEGLVTVSFNGGVNFIYTKDGKFSIQAPSATPITVDAMDDNGNTAATVTVPPLASGEQRDMGSIKICGTNTTSFIDIAISGTNNYYGTIALSPDGSRLAMMSYNKNGATVYETKTGTVVVKFHRRQ
jgi:hypothetical protein